MLHTLLDTSSQLATFGKLSTSHLDMETYRSVSRRYVGPVQLLYTHYYQAFHRVSGASGLLHVSYHPNRSNRPMSGEQALVVMLCARSDLHRTLFFKHTVSLPKRHGFTLLISSCIYIVNRGYTVSVSSSFWCRLLSHAVTCKVYRGNVTNTIRNDISSTKDGKDEVRNQSVITHPFYHLVMSPTSPSVAEYYTMLILRQVGRSGCTYPLYAYQRLMHTTSFI